MLSVSIIISTQDRRDSLNETLSSLACLSYPKDKYEVIVIDDGSSDDTREMIAGMRHSLPYPLTYDRLIGKKGISAARNQGMRMAKGMILVFTDDDCLFEEEWLAKLVDPFRCSGVGAVGGLDQTPADASFFSKCVGFLFTSFIGTGGLRGGGRFRVGKYYPKGCNMAVHRDAISKVGGFDEHLGPGEEIELGYRIGRAGYQIKYVEMAYVWHKRRTTLKAFLQKIFGIGYTRVVLARKHKGLLQLGHMIPFLSGLTAFSLLILSLIFPNALRVLMFILGGYVLLLLVSGIQALFRIGDIRALLLIPFLILLHHATHGIGFLVAGIKHLFQSVEVS